MHSFRGIAGEDTDSEPCGPSSLLMIERGSKRTNHHTLILILLLSIPLTLGTFNYDE
jgi:hypothetical protein